MAYTDNLLKMTQRQKSKKKNNDELMNVKMRLILMRLKTFKWSGLPDTCNERMLELSLMQNGFGMFRNIDGHIVNLIATPDGSLNIYGDPTGLWGYGLNGYNKHGLTYIEGGENLLPMNQQSGTVDTVMVKDNDLAFPFMSYVDAYAQRIADTQRSMDVVTSMLQSPCLITCTEEDRSKIIRVLTEIDEKCPWIVGINAAPYDSLKVLDTGAKPETLTTLKEYKDNLESEYAMLCGINSNPSIDKKERLIVPEVDANNDQTELCVVSALEERQKACRIANKFFGLNLSCEMRYTMDDDESLNLHIKDGDTDDGDDNKTQNITGDNA